MQAAKSSIAHDDHAVASAQLGHESRDERGHLGEDARLGAERRGDAIEVPVESRGLVEPDAVRSGKRRGKPSIVIATAVG